MLDADILNQLKEASIEERIRIIEMILKSLKQDLRASKVQSVATQRPLRGTVRHYEEPYDSAARPTPTSSLWLHERYRHHPW